MIQFKRFLVFPVYLLNFIQYIIGGKTYYPEKKQKSKIVILKDQIFNYIRYGKVERYYYMYGLDVLRGSDYSAYVNYVPFMKRRNYLNYESHPYNNSCAILRNKFYFAVVAKSLNIPTPKILFYYLNSKLYRIEEGNTSLIESTFEDIIKLENNTLFCKQVDGECGENVFKLRIFEHQLYVKDKRIEPAELELLIKQGNYIFQEAIEQHKEMSMLNPSSINTMRLITIRNKEGGISLFPSILRIGTNGSFVDNTSQGGIAVGINMETGKLLKYGFQKPAFGTKVESHPNSNINFSNFLIPFFQQAVQLALYFHSFLSDIHSIGWDIAITENGPTFIEGNDNWEINGPQVCHGGLKKLIKEYMDL